MRCPKNPGERMLLGPVHARGPEWLGHCVPPHSGAKDAAAAHPRRYRYWRPPAAEPGGTVWLNPKDTAPGPEKCCWRLRVRGLNTQDVAPSLLPATRFQPGAAGSQAAEPRGQGASHPGAKAGLSPGDTHSQGQRTLRQIACMGRCYRGNPRGWDASLPRVKDAPENCLRGETLPG